MSNIQIKTCTGGTAVLSDEAVTAFQAGLRGQVLTGNTPGYDEARSIWNAMIDRRPALIARCAGAADVVHAVRFARTHDLLTAVRGGGHNIAGNALCDGGLVIDCSQMKSVRIDAVARLAHVEAGATLGDFDHDAQVFGLATPLGINSTTGVAGLTLGGGFGWLSRSKGLTIDNLLSVDVVTTEGELVRTSATERPDLFWGLRGGGGNFGIATSFEFRLHPVGPIVLAGLVIHSLDAARDVFRFYREFIHTTPEDFTCWWVLRQAPPFPFLDAEWHGKEIMALAVCYFGDPKEGERIAQPLRSFGKPIADIIGPTPYTDWQKILDPALTPGERNYWKTNEFVELSDGLIDTLVDYTLKIPDPQTEIACAYLGGAVSRIPDADTAYTNRNALWIMNVHGRWSDAAKDEKCVAWARGLFRDTAKFSTGGAYMNFLTQEEGDRIPAAYGANYKRLVQLKNKYDPKNFFSINQNIKPTV